MYSVSLCWLWLYKYSRLVRPADQYDRCTRDSPNTSVIVVQFYYNYLIITTGHVSYFIFIDNFSIFIDIKDQILTTVPGSKTINYVTFRIMVFAIAVVQRGIGIVQCGQRYCPMRAMMLSNVDIGVVQRGHRCCPMWTTILSNVSKDVVQCRQISPW